MKTRYKLSVLTTLIYIFLCTLAFDSRAGVAWYRFNRNWPESLMNISSIFGENFNNEFRMISYVDDIEDIYISYFSQFDNIETYYIDSVNGNDSNNGLSPETAFATIQKGINSSENGDIVFVYPGIYREEINFLSKAITV